MVELLTVNFDIASAFSSSLFNHFINLTWLFSFTVALYVYICVYNIVALYVAVCMSVLYMYVVVCGYVL